MALPPRVLYLLCVGDNAEMYETLKINDCLSSDALFDKKGFLKNFENFNKKLLEEYSKEEITGGWKKPIVGLNGFDKKIRFLEGTNYLNDYAFTLNNMNYHDYELCSKCRKLFLKAESETQCFECSEPLVGWLVIVDGKGKGKDIQIFAGQNSIGRDKSNMICIDFGDNTIARIKHAFIIFDKKNELFFFTSGVSVNLSYLNNETVYSPIEMNNGDIIEIGETKLKFVALWTKSFKW